MHPIQPGLDLGLCGSLFEHELNLESLVKLARWHDCTCVPSEIAGRKVGQSQLSPQVQ